MGFKRFSVCYLEIDLTDRSRSTNTRIRETSWEAVAIIYAGKIVMVAFIGVMVEVIRKEVNSEIEDLLNN